MRIHARKPQWLGSRQFPSLAVIGCGGVAAERHLPALARLGWCPRVLVDPRIERASQLSRRFKAHRALRNVSELAAGEIQAALVATNMASHASVSLSLLENGVHVFVEKPMAVSFDEASAMVKTAAANSACLAVGHIRRFMFINRWVKKLIQSGALGDIESFDVREGENFHTRSGGRLTRARAIERTGLYSPAFWDLGVSGGGVLLDTGSHTLDTLLWQIGEAQALRYQDDALGGVEADALLQLQLANGATGTVELSRTRNLRNTAILTGRRGQIEVSLHRNEIIRARPDKLILFEIDGRSGAAMPNEHLHQDMFKREIEDWLQAIHSGGDPFVSGASAATAIRIIDRCYHIRRPLHPREPKKPFAKSRPGKTTLALVTGASGFIGGRLVEKLASNEAVKVRAAVRTFRNAARVSPFSPEKVELRHFDMTAQSVANGAYESLVEGCDTVFHLARDTRSRKANEEGVRQLGAACQKAGIRRFVYVSSMSVYEPLPNAPLTEESPAGRLPYNDKLAAEREVMRMIQEDGLQAAIIQPTIVYGPFSSHWTDRPANMLVEGAIVLPSPVDGICNAVYIDDLIHALMLAAQREEAIGKTFLISGPERLTWLEFYSNYATALGREDAIRLMPYDEINRRSRGADSLLSLPTPKRVLDYPPLRPLRQALLSLYDRLGDNHKAKARRFYEQGRLIPFHRPEALPEFLPTKRLLDLYAAKCPIQINKARRILGYKPVFTMERGMEITTRYLHWAHGHRINKRKG